MKWFNWAHYILDNWYEKHPRCVVRFNLILFVLLFTTVWRPIVFLWVLYFYYRNSINYKDYDEWKFMNIFSKENGIVLMDMISEICFSLICALSCLMLTYLMIQK